jgi:hypothetical protein
MHAVVVRVTIKDADAATTELTEQVVPRVTQAPGFKTGYWTRKDDNGLAMIIFESEEAAKTASEAISSMAGDNVSVDHVAVREVVASA